MPSNAFDTSPGTITKPAGSPCDEPVPAGEAPTSESGTSSLYPCRPTPRTASRQLSGRTLTDHRVERNRTVSPEVASPWHLAGARIRFAAPRCMLLTSFGCPGDSSGRRPNGSKADGRILKRFGLFASAGTMAAQWHCRRVSDFLEGEGTISRSRCLATRRIRK